ncbi:MAG: RpiB/LacA/LacB family sugar-phosphate isomerase [Proteobacteria bacterium]|nr:RpiB/LacA/LacB family sugar-phosphate isomerase [Pseudomonadota bacterium]
MKISVASDHAGFEFKQRLKRELESQGHEVVDFGTGSDESCDYPDYAEPAVREVAAGAADRAILACTNGIGMSMLANRVPGAMAALVYNERSAAMTRRHHGSNVLCLGAGEFPAEDLLRWVRIWLGEEFEGGRHARRIGKVKRLEERG